MLIVEDIALLLTDDATGRGLVDSSRLDLALAGGLLLDMIGAGVARISGPGDEVRAGRVVLTGSATSGDPLLDGGVSLLAGRRPAKPADVLPRLHKGLRAAVYARLAERGIVRASQERVLGIFPTTRWPAVDSAHEARVRAALRDVLVVGRTPTPLEASLIALLHAVGQVPKVVATDEVPRRELARRAKTVATGNVGGAAVASAIAAVQAGLTAAMVATTAAASS